MRLIDKDALINALLDYTWRDEEDASIDDADLKRRFIEEWFPEVPLIDTVEGVRCRDCVFFERSTVIPVGICTHLDGLVNPKLDSFCSYGKAK